MGVKSVGKSPEKHPRSRWQAGLIQTTNHRTHAVQIMSDVDLGPGDLLLVWNHIRSNSKFDHCGQRLPDRLDYPPMMARVDQTDDGTYACTPVKFKTKKLPLQKVKKLPSTDSRSDRSPTSAARLVNR